MNELLSYLAAWLVDVAVLGTALLAASALLQYLLRQPAARMGVARGTLLGLATLCLLTALPSWPRQHLDEFLSGRQVETEENEEASVLGKPVTATASPLLIDVPAGLDEKSSPIEIPTPSLTIAKCIHLVPLLWLGTAICAVAYVLLGAWRAFRLLQSAGKAPDWSQQELERLVANKNRSPRLKTSERIATAVAMLAWRPHILLAAKSVREENKAAVRAALAHEWAHIRHGDLWLLALERLLLPIFCLHPLFWLLRRQIRSDQELLADAAAAGDAPVEYAQALLIWAKAESNAAAPRLGIAALSLWEHPSNISRRVEMLLHPPSVSVRCSCFWKWLAPLSLLAAVFGLSLVTLRPAAVAQDDTSTDREGQTLPMKVKKSKKAKPAKKETNREATTSPDRSLSRAPAGNTQVLLQIVVGRVEHAALEKAESSLGDLIQAASEDHCRLEGNLIVAELTAEKFATLTNELRQSHALDILSEPKIVTLDGQEARLQIGGQVSLMQLEETVKSALEEIAPGDPNRRVKFQEIGETIIICPYINDKNPTKLTLDIKATHIELDKRAKRTTGDDIPKFIKHEFSLEVEATVGKTLVITEREPKKGSGRGHSLLLSIVPQKIAPADSMRAPKHPMKAESDLPDSVHSFHKWKDLTAESCLKCHNVTPPKESRDDKELPIGQNHYDSLRQENAALRKQIEDMRGRLIGLEVQIRWLREAAAAGGEDKVNDEMFLRRVYLDLTGRVPTAEESREFLKDQNKQKRDKLIDKLLQQRVFRDPGEAEEWKKAHPKSTNFDPLTTEPQPKNVPAEEPILQVIHLSRISASDAAKLLDKLFALEKKRPDIVVEERTNSLLFRGSRVELQLLTALVAELDREPDPKVSNEKPEPQDKSDSAGELRIMDIRKADATLQAARAQFQRMQILRKENAVSESEVAKALHQLRHAELTLEAVKGGKATPKLLELEMKELEALVASQRAQLEDLGKDDPGRAKLEWNLQLSRQHLEDARARLEEAWSREGK
ncbi:MAG: M56 family metallopeptidase [Pirellulaceae bacterium]